jgi:hypothetical protein
MNQIDFEKTISEFQKIEDARDQLWDRAKVLIEKGFEVEAYILILATWNFARFRYFMKKFDLREFQEVINQVNPVFKKLENTHFENINFTDTTVATDIKYIYNKLKKIAEQTGASKIMALKNSKLFVMWDTEIRKIYKIDNKGEADDYIQFLTKMQKYFEDIKWSGKTPPLAKAIDEYNYVIANRNRGARKIKSKQN